MKAQPKPIEKNTSKRKKTINQNLGKPSQKPWQQVYIAHMMSLAVRWNGQYPAGFCVYRYGELG